MSSRTHTPSGLPFTSEVPKQPLLLFAAWQSEDRSRMHRDSMLLAGAGKKRRLVWTRHVMRSLFHASADGPAEQIEADYDALRLESLISGQSALRKLPKGELDARAVNYAISGRVPSDGDERWHRPVQLPTLTQQRAQDKTRQVTGWTVTAPRTVTGLLQTGTDVQHIHLHAPEGTWSSHLRNWLAGTDFSAGPTALLEIDMNFQNDLRAFEAHDLLSLEGIDLRDRPWAERHALLGEVLAELQMPELRRVATANFLPAGASYSLVETDAGYGKGIYRIVAG